MNVRNTLHAAVAAGVLSVGAIAVLDIALRPQPILSPAQIDSVLFEWRNADDLEQAPTQPTHFAASHVRRPTAKYPKPRVFKPP